jgi:hypothetical protein
MSNILKRTVFMSRNNDGTIRVLDWAKVIMDNGQTYAEPFRFGALWSEGSSIDDFNGSDQMARVDDIEWIDDPSMLDWYLCGGDDNVTGGAQVPKLSVGGNASR